MNMEKTILLNGSFEEMESIFNDSKQLSIRFFKEIKDNKYEVIIRYNDNLDSFISKCKTLKQLKKIDALELNYYDDEFNKIQDIRGLNFKFTGWQHSTKELNTNLDSIAALKRFIKRVEKQIKKASK